MLLQQVLRCKIKMYHFENIAVSNTDPIGNKVCIKVREGAGISTYEKICLSCTVACW